MTYHPSVDPAAIGGTVGAGTVPHVLLVGSDIALGQRLAGVLQPAIVRSVIAPNETEGLDIDIVVIAAEFPFYELTELAVHPTLGDTPVVIYAPGYRPPPRHDELGATNVRMITDGSDPFERLVDAVRTHLN